MLCFVLNHGINLMKKMELYNLSLMHHQLFTLLTHWLANKNDSFSYLGKKKSPFLTPHFPPATAKQFLYSLTLTYSKQRLFQALSLLEPLPPHFHHLYSFQISLHLILLGSSNQKRTSNCSHKHDPPPTPLHLAL